MDKLQIRLVAWTLVIFGVLSLLWIMGAYRLQSTGIPAQPHPVPALTPYPDPLRGGVGTWQPRP